MAIETRTTVGADFIDELLRHIRQFDALTEFPTVDEIWSRADQIMAESSGSVRRTRVGTSRLGEPLYRYTVGSGPAVLVIGGVHPNEPIGFHTALQLMEDVALQRGPAAKLPVTWEILPCIDPDGARLNQSWFQNPGDRVTYAKDFYRPAPIEQVEWSFPLDHKRAYFDRSIPETQAVMRVVDQIHPIMAVGLHNGELGGVYYYISRLSEALEEALQRIPQQLGLPLDKGEPEISGVEPLGTAIFPAPRARDIYDSMEAVGVDPVGRVQGGGLADYLEAYGTLTFVAELPYWSHPDSDSADPADELYVEVLRRKGRELSELGTVLVTALDMCSEHLRIDSQLSRAAAVFSSMMQEISDAEDQRAERVDSQRTATVAEVFSNADLVRCFRLRFGSMLYRTFHTEILAGTAAPQVRNAAAYLKPYLDQWYEEARSVTGLTTWPIEKLVGVQYGTLTAVAAAAVAEVS
ncbi:M14 family zinc carboxypeptidase [Nesterenkonia muleiensis]|uniref:M14 family zinc carboxypeptidase n=1 Tax=Nesterenkonia muleiensis TaxID=2282648 RepID=UPI000E75CDC4|nr:M14 family zinc carboxypeptidase [Nesterenkonia muleiensis]